MSDNTNVSSYYKMPFMDRVDLPEYLVRRSQEIQQISEGLTKHNSVIIEGDPGIGKTVLVRTYKELNPLNFKKVHYFRGAALDFAYPGITLLRDKQKVTEKSLFIIDGFDEIYSREIKNDIYSLIKEGRKYGIQSIITSRPFNIENKFENNSHLLKLNGLSQSEAMSLIQRCFQNNQFVNFKLEDINVLLNALGNNPLGIFYAAELLKGKQFTPTQIISLLNENILYKNSKLNSPGESKIILPQTTQLITDIKIVNSRLIDKVDKNPSFMYSMTPRQFEEFVAELFQEDGYNVTLTKQTGDGGKDLFIVENKRVGNFIYYVECKQFSPDKPVGVRLVRELYGTVMKDRVTAGLLVTSSYFSKVAKDFTEEIKSQISLLDYSDIKSWVDEITNTD